MLLCCRPKKILGPVVLPGKIVLRSTRVHTTLLQVPGEEGRHVCDLHRRHRTADGRHVPRLRALLSPTGLGWTGRDWARVAQPSSSLPCWSAWSALVDFCGTASTCRDVGWMVAGEGAARGQPPTRAIVRTVDAAPTIRIACHPACDACLRASLEGIGDLASWPLGDGWVVKAGGLRDVKVAGRGSPQMSLTKLKRRPPEARDP